MKQILSLAFCLLIAGGIRTSAQCNAQFSAVPSPTGNDLLGVTFTNSSTVSNPNPTAYTLTTIDFGDNTGMAYFNNPTYWHDYLNPGTYTAMLVVSSYDSSATGPSTLYCTDTAYQTVVVAYSPCGATFIQVNTGNGSYAFYASNPASTSGVTYTWDFGDGSSTTALTSNQVGHTYAANGYYPVTLTCTAGGCTYANTESINVNSTTAPASNLISGMVTWDSISNNNWPDSIEVWLITHDATANTLTAIDSQYLNASYPFYTFNNKPAGDYLVKAAFLGQTAGVVGYLPTYHLASVYWNSATTITHSTGTDASKDINMQSGTVTAGPGFIGGNISLGAGRGTNTGVPNLLVYLRGNNNQLISSTLTDNNGDYSFPNIAIGTYSIYPEEINYTTTPYNTIVVSAGQTQVQGIDFEQQDNLIFPKNPGTTGISNITITDGLNIYPNPAKGLINIDNQNNLFNQVKIVDAIGQMIKDVNLKNGLNKVDITTLNAGIYYLLISGEDAVRSMKIVKE